MPEWLKNMWLDILRENADKIESLEAEYNLCPEKVLELTSLNSDIYMVSSSDTLICERGGHIFFAAY